MTDIAPFFFSGNSIRVVIDENGEPLFVGRDICDALGYSNAAAAISSHCKGVAKHYPLQTRGGVQDARVLAEPDVLRLIINCSLPAADAFERLVFEEILPAIRKTGQYVSPATVPAIPPNFAAALRLAADQQEVIQAQTEQLAAAAPAVEFVDKYVDSTGLKGFRQVAKLLHANEHQFRRFLEEAKIMYRLGGEWTPFAQHLDTGRFDVRAGTSGTGHAFNTARFTPKGVLWVTGEFAKWQLQQKSAEVNDA